VEGVLKIVSLAPSNTEIVAALGKVNQLVGVTACCDYPEQVKSIKQIGGYASPDVEKIIELNPDIVLATEMDLKKGVVPKLKDKGVNVSVVNGSAVTELAKAVLHVGELINCQEQAGKLAEKIKLRIEAVTKKAEEAEHKPKTCYICSSNPLCTGTQSPVIDKLIVTAGAENIMAGVKADSIEDYLKTVIKIDPEVIIISEGHKEAVDLLSYAEKGVDLKKTKAYLNGRVYKIDSKLVCRPGPRTVEGLERVSGFVYP